jgi:outer membrane protein TolC
VATAAETASTYVELRACEARTQQIETDAGSRDASAGLTQRMVEAGMQAPAQAALARASAAQGQAAVLQQAAACDTLVKSLVALTAIDEPALRLRLQPAQARLPQPRALAVDTVPAQALAQRPDLRAAAQDLLAASADVRQADADRWPRISIGGFLGHMRVGDGPGRDQGSVWQLGPLTVSLPVFDAGLRSANADAARARHDAAESVYRGALRQAVREVESALVELQSAAGREPALQRAAADYRVSFVSVEQRQRGGLATVFELEDARRTDVGAQLALTDVRRERVLAWIALYRALGGGWNGAQAAPLALAAR